MGTPKRENEPDRGLALSKTPPSIAPMEKSWEDRKSCNTFSLFERQQKVINQCTWKSGTTCSSHKVLTPSPSPSLPQPQAYDVARTQNLTRILLPLVYHTPRARKKKPHRIVGSSGIAVGSPSSENPHPKKEAARSLIPIPLLDNTMSGTNKQLPNLHPWLRRWGRKKKCRV